MADSKVVIPPLVFPDPLPIGLEGSSTEGLYSRITTWLSATADTLIASGNPNFAVFPIAYEAATRSIAEDGELRDRPFILHCAIEFARIYYSYLDRLFNSPSIAEAWGGLPECWGIAFKHAETREGYYLQDLLLGMVCHIMYDLPLAVAKAIRQCNQLSDATYSVDLVGSCRTEHDLVSNNLCKRINEVQEAIHRRVGGITSLLDVLFGDEDEKLTAVLIGYYREHAFATGLDYYTLGFESPSANQTTLRAVTTIVDRQCSQLAYSISIAHKLFWGVPDPAVVRGFDPGNPRGFEEAKRFADSLRRMADVAEEWKRVARARLGRSVITGTAAHRQPDEESDD